jgi:uncharacterized membrane protein
MEQYSSNRGRSAFAAASLIGIAAAGVLIALQRRGQPRMDRRARSQGIYVHEAITVNRPLAEVYQFWRNFENFPSFMSHLESVRTTASGRSRWRAIGPAGARIEWEADIIGEQEHEWIAWRSIEESDIQHSGSVRFEHAPGARGTEVHVQLRYDPHGGTVAHAIARLFGEDPERQIREDLRRFKQLLEAGEIPVSDGPGLWRPAQPAERPEDIKAHMGVLR